MKRKFLLPVLAVALAVGSAVASNRFSTGYFEAGDSSCEGSYNLEPQCNLGNDEDCTDGTNPYYQKAEPTLPTSPENPCEIVRRQVQ